MAQSMCLVVLVVALTGCSLEGIDGSVYAGGCRAVLSRPHLGVQSADVEEHAAFLEGQRPLTGRDARQRVIPGGWAEQRASSSCHHCHCNGVYPQCYRVFRKRTGLQHRPGSQENHGVN